MRSLIAALIPAICALGSVSLVPAQTLLQPGTLASAVAPPAASVPAVPPDSAIRPSIASVHDDRDKVANRVWLASAFALGAASGFDAATSWGKREGNPLLASSNGDFGAKGLAIKSGITAALIIPQIWLHKHREYRTTLTVVNFANAALFSGVAIHNMGIAPPPHN
jgi:hypothetical protein